MTNHIHEVTHPSEDLGGQLVVGVELLEHRLTALGAGGNVVNLLLEHGLEALLNTPAADQEGWAGGVSRRVVALTVGNISFVWVVASEGVGLTIVDLLSDDGNLAALGVLPLDADVTDLTGGGAVGIEVLALVSAVLEALATNQLVDDSKVVIG